MNVTVTQKTDWNRALNAARWTVNKESTPNIPTDKWKSKILLAEHSPIRLVEYDVQLEEIPNKVAMHLVRHFNGVEKFVGTHRSDRSENNDEEVNRNTPTNLWLAINAQALKNMSYKRLCYCAEKETRETWEAVKTAVAEIDQVMADKMVPECVRCHGNCPELKSCGFCNTKKAKDMINKYWNENV